MYSTTVVQCVSALPSGKTTRSTSVHAISFGFLARHCTWLADDMYWVIHKRCTHTTRAMVSFSCQKCDCPILPSRSAIITRGVRKFYIPNFFFPPLLHFTETFRICLSSHLSLILLLDPRIAPCLNNLFFRVCVYIVQTHIFQSNLLEREVLLFFFLQ